MIIIEKRQLENLANDLAKLGVAADLVIEKALMKGAVTVERAVSEAAPVETGELKRSVKIGDIRENRRGVTSIAIGPEKGNMDAAYYGRMLEYGTKYIDPKEHRFEGPAFKRVESQVAREMISIIENEIDKAFR